MNKRTLIKPRSSLIQVLELIGGVIGLMVFFSILIIGMLITLLGLIIIPIIILPLHKYFKLGNKYLNNKTV